MQATLKVQLLQMTLEVLNANALGRFLHSSLYFLTASFEKQSYKLLFAVCSLTLLYELLEEELPNLKNSQNMVIFGKWKIWKEIWRKFEKENLKKGNLKKEVWKRKFEKGNLKKENLKKEIWKRKIRKRKFEKDHTFLYILNESWKLNEN